MTVCVTAMCRNFANQLVVVGASDRMLTLGDHEWEPPATKIFRFPSKVPVVAMTAGGVTDQAAINESTHLHLYANPSSSVREITYLYAEKFAERRRYLAETKYLKPLGLTTQSFLERQASMPPDLVLTLAGQLQREALSAETLIVGVDDHGPHIYKILDPGEALLHNSVGYAAVGYGARQAESAFMFSGYSVESRPGRALYAVYAAKRRAEVAPSVGRTTDMFVMSDSTYMTLPDALVQHLESMFSRSRDLAKQAQETELKKFEDELGAAAKTAVQEPAPTEPTGIKPQAEEKKS